MIIKKRDIKQNKRPVVLILVDGFGIGPLTEGNLFNQAETPFLDKLATDYPIGVLRPIRIKKTTPAMKRQLAYAALGAGRRIKEEELAGALTGENLGYSFFSLVISQAGLKQIFIAESEKYAFLTEFLSGRLGRSDWSLVGWESILVPSRLWEGDRVPLIMAAEEINRRLQMAVAKKYDFIVVSYANIEAAVLAGDFEFGVKVVEVMDKILAGAIEAVLKENGVVVLTSAYGGAEKMVDVQTGKVSREATIAPVPLMVVGEKFAGRSLGWPETAIRDLSAMPPVGRIIDIAPTILDLLGLPKAKTMAGKSLV